jgi:hypothetical protein
LRLNKVERSHYKRGMGSRVWGYAGIYGFLQIKASAQGKVFRFNYITMALHLTCSILDFLATVLSSIKEWSHEAVDFGNMKWRLAQSDRVEEGSRIEAIRALHRATSPLLA